MQKLISAGDLTHDAFLGGKLHLWQPRKGYRAGIDAVLLAASVPAKMGDTVLELGCGVGTAALCLAARIPGLRITGVELQPAYADLARQNATACDAEMTVVAADLRALPPVIRNAQYAQVIMNPPYFERAKGDPADDCGRDIGRRGDTPLADWLDIGIKRTAPKGHMTLIQHITRLPEVLGLVNNRLGSLTVLPIAPRHGQPPNLFLLQGKVSGRKPFVMRPAFVLHDGTAHDGDRESYTAVTKSILRDAAELPISD